MATGKSAVLPTVVVLTALLAAVAAVAEARHPQPAGIWVLAAILAVAGVCMAGRSEGRELTALVFVFCVASANRLVVPVAAIHVAVRPAAVLIVPAAMVAILCPPKGDDHFFGRPCATALLAAVTAVGVGLALGYAVISRYHGIDTAPLLECALNLSLIAATYLTARTFLECSGKGVFGAALVSAIALIVLVARWIAGAAS